MHDQRIRIAFIDEERLLVDLLSDRLRQSPRFDVAWTACRSEDGLRMLGQDKPDLVVVDIQGEARGMLDVIDSLAAKKVPVRFVILTWRVSSVVMNEVHRLKVAGYLLKSEPLDVILKGLEQIARGEFCFTAEAAKCMKRIPHQQLRRVDGQHAPAALTGRQIEVLRHLAVGKSTREIAECMHILPKSVENHRYRIMRKLDIHNSIELARFAIREGISRV